MSKSRRSAVLTALAANLAITISKLVAFLLTGSTALLAETLHSFADSGNQGLLPFGEYRASVDPDPEHPFGRGRERYFYAFVVGLVLFGLGGVFSIVEGIRHIGAAGRSLDNPQLAIGLVAVAAVFESVSLRTGLKAFRARRPAGDGLLAALRETRDPEVAIVVLEDSAALLGLLLAFCGLVASVVLSDPRWDAGASVAIGLVLCLVATAITIQTHALLVGEPALPDELSAIRTAIAETPGVRGLLNLRTEHIGPDQLLVCAKVDLTAVRLTDAVTVIDEVERRVHAAVPSILTCYIEPDEFDAGRAGGPWS